MNRAILYSAAAFVLILQPHLSAQVTALPNEVHSEQGPIASAARSATDNADLVLGPGDQVQIRVLDMDELPDRPIRIDPDGKIDLPLIGSQQASGLTVGQLKRKLSEQLVRYISNPQISINLIESQSRPVSVIGQVNAPGVHQLPGPRSLLEVISMAGGVKSDAGSKVIITRQTKSGDLALPEAHRDSSGQFSSATLKLDDLLAAKDPDENIQIKPGDVISIPKADIIYVVGAVKRAGGFPLASHESISVLQALSLAEGLGLDPATQNSRILRPVPGKDSKPQEIAVNVKSIFAGKAPDVPLYAGDILFVPTSAAKTGTRRAAEAILQAATGIAVYSR